MKNYQKILLAFVITVIIISFFVPSKVIAQQTTKKEKLHCIGITKKGVQCKRVVMKANTYCFQHSKETDIKNKK